MRADHARGAAGRFGAGLPRISDGQLLFLLHMLAHAKDPKDGGSRIAIIMNGSPLFTGDAGSGESEIRRFILEHDLLEALIALPEQLFAGSLVFIKPQGPVDLHDIRHWWHWTRGADWRHPYGPDSSIDGLDQHPVVHVSFADAEAFAKW